MEGVERVGGGGDGANCSDGEEGDGEEGGVRGEYEDDIVSRDVEVVEEGLGEEGDVGFEVGES